MPADATVGVIGLGLIGGSLARDFATLGVHVLGFDADPESLRAALAAGAVHRALTPDLAGLAAADIVILAVPVTEAPGVLARIRPHIGSATLVTDVGSTKQSITRAAAALGLESQFVGGHPFAGDHRGGWHASRAGLFAGARVFLCPTSAAHPHMTERATQLWRTLGAEPTLLAPAEHDRLLAFVSHLPQAVAFLVAGALTSAGVARASLGPGGRDTLRLAASPAPLWTGIALDNADELARALNALRTRIVELEDALRAADARHVQALFETGHRWYADV